MPNDYTQNPGGPKGKGPGVLPAMMPRDQQKAGTPYDLNQQSVPPGGTQLLQDVPAGRAGEVQGNKPPFRVG